MKLLLIGLGNIGDAYTYTRHNVGFLALDHLAKLQKASFQIDRLAFIASFVYRQHRIYMVKPTTYMNDSGKAVRYWLQTLHIPIEQSLTMVDDITLPFGTLRLRAQGSDAGHNGLKSIATCLDSNQYPRLRMGIGSNFPKGKLVDFVLSNFSSEELSALSVQLDKVSEMILTWCTAGMVHAMNQYNKS
jgi:PTH1 family peptidyl-tRNA hydrolase